MAEETAPTTARTLLRNRAFAVAMAIAVVVALGFGLVVPVLPLFARSFGVSLFAATALVSVFAAVRFLSNFATGALSDRIGTRRAIAWGAIVVAASSVASGLAPTYGALVVFRGIGGFGSALFFNALLSHVILMVPADYRGRAVGLLQGAFLFGILFGPTVGGALAEPLGLRWPLIIYGGFCLAAAGVALVGLPRVESAEASEGGERGPRALLAVAARFLRDPAFVAALVMMAASRWSATGVRFSLVPLFGEEVVGAGALLVGVALTLSSVSHAATLWPAGRIIDLYGRRRLAAPAYLAFGMASVALAWATSVPAFLLVMALYGIGTGLTSVTPPAIVGDVAGPADTGKAVGVLNTAGDLGSVGGPVVSGWLADEVGYGAAFGLSGALLMLAALVALGMRETLPARRSGTV